MTKARFHVGKDEKHTIDVSYSFWTAHLEILVDEREIASKHVLGLSSVSRFSVGDKEQHHIEVKVGGVNNDKIELYVDGKLEGTG